MLQDALLAWIHYLAIFVLVVVMTAEAVLLRPAWRRTQCAGSRSMTASTCSRRWPLAVLATACCAGAKGGRRLLCQSWFHAKITLSS